MKQDVISAILLMYYENQTFKKYKNKFLCQNRRFLDVLNLLWGDIVNQELKTVFKNSGITILIIFVYGLIIRQNSVYIASTVGAILSIWNLYSMYKDAVVLVYKKNE